MHRIGVLLLVLIGFGCGAADPAGVPTTTVVATSIPPHAWLIERIGGDAVEVHTVLRPGESPTTHQPSDLQVSRVLSGRVFFRSGTPFESGAWFRALEGQLERRLLEFRDAEIHDPDLVLVRDQDVRGLEIAMDDAGVVDRVEPRRDLRRDLAQLPHKVEAIATTPDGDFLAG